MHTYEFGLQIGNVLEQANVGVAPTKLQKLLEFIKTDEETLDAIVDATIGGRGVDADVLDVIVAGITELLSKHLVAPAGLVGRSCFTAGCQIGRHNESHDFFLEHSILHRLKSQKAIPVLGFDLPAWASSCDVTSVI